MTGRVLVAGWFSFPWMGATAGDVLAARTVVDRARDAGRHVDVALSDALSHIDPSGVRWDEVDPTRYDDLLVVCGPIGDAPPLTDLLERFAASRRAAVDVTRLQPRFEWDPFDRWWVRDGVPDEPARPDLAFAAPPTAVPVVALVLAHRQREYGDRARHDEVGRVLRDVLADRDVAVVEVDTCFDPENAGGLRTPGQVEAVLRAADAVVTTRLHGLVLGLRVGTPVLAVDPVAGGAKVAAQASAVGWPEVLLPDEVDETAVGAALDRLLDGHRRADVDAALSRADRALTVVGDELGAWLGAGRGESTGG